MIFYYLFRERRHDTEEPPNQRLVESRGAEFSLFIAMFQNCDLFFYSPSSEIELNECQAYGHTTNRSQANEETIYMN